MTAPSIAAGAGFLRTVRSVVVLGAEPRAGQTCVATALLRALCREGINAVGMQPVARGTVTAGGTWRSDELQQLAAASAFRLPPHVLCAHRLDNRPGPPPTLEAVVDTFRVLSTWADTLVVDGATGAPFGSRALVRGLGLPFVFVVGAASARAGAAVEQARALVRSGLECAGWVLVAATPVDIVGAAWQERMPGACLGTLACSAGAQGLDVPRMLQALAA